MLRKDDAFEVVFDPGTDEVEKQCLGPVPATSGNTGEVPISQLNTARLNGEIVSDPVLCVNFASLAGSRGWVWSPYLSSHSEKASGVETATFGSAMTQGMGGRSCSGKTCSPRP